MNPPVCFLYTRLVHSTTSKTPLWVFVWSNIWYWTPPLTQPPPLLQAGAIRSTLFLLRLIKEFTLTRVCWVLIFQRVITEFSTDHCCTVMWFQWHELCDQHWPYKSVVGHTDEVTSIRPVWAVNNTTSKAAEFLTPAGSDGRRCDHCCLMLTAAAWCRFFFTVQYKAPPGDSGSDLVLNKYN